MQEEMNMANKNYQIETQTHHTYAGSSLPQPPQQTLGPQAMQILWGIQSGQIDPRDPQLQQDPIGQQVLLYIKKYL